MAWTKTFLLKTGTIAYQSSKYDLFFVSKTIEVGGNGGSKYKRTRYCTFARGRHRKKEQSIIWMSKEEWLCQLNFCKTQDKIHRDKNN